MYVLCSINSDICTGCAVYVGRPLLPHGSNCTTSMMSYGTALYNYMDCTLCHNSDIIIVQYRCIDHEWPQCVKANSKQDHDGLFYAEAVLSVLQTTR